MKIIKNEICGDSGGLSSDSRLQECTFGAPAYAFWRPFGATWPILGAILDPAGFQGGSKNHVFVYHIGKMMKKECPETKPENTSKCD